MDPYAFRRGAAGSCPHWQGVRKARVDCSSISISDLEIVSFWMDAYRRFNCIRD